MSVVIPTRDRASSLLLVLDLLRRETSQLGYPAEIVVVDDGSVQEMAGLIDDAASKDRGAAAVRCLRQPASGPAAARNLGVRAAEGDVVLFLGDDILPGAGLLSRHMALQSENQAGDLAVLGVADLAPELCRTPFVRWWRRWNFRYDRLISGQRKPDYSFFYTNNLSVPRRFLLNNGLFDEEFRGAAYEDSELGFRLINRGLRLVFEQAAQAVHWHTMDLESACRRMLTRGGSYDLFRRKTGMPGMSKMWLALGTGPWMGSRLLRPLYWLADKSQHRFEPGVLYVLVLMHFFQAGRRRISLKSSGGVPKCAQSG